MFGTSRDDQNGDHDHHDASDPRAWFDPLSGALCRSAAGALALGDVVDPVPARVAEISDRVCAYDVGGVWV